MSARNNYYKIGLFVLAAVVLLLVGLFAFGLRTYFKPYMEFETYINGSVDGLVVGSPVKLNGVKIGKVKLVDFVRNHYPGSHGSYVLVRYEIDKNLFILSEKEIRSVLPELIKKGLRARVTSQGITGNSFIAFNFLDPERNPIEPIDWQPKYLWVPSTKSEITQMVDSLERTLKKLEKVDLEAIGGNIDKLLVEVRQTNLHAQYILENIDQAQIKEIIQNIEQVTANLNEVLLSLKTYPSQFILGGPPTPTQSLPPQKKKE